MACGNRRRKLGIFVRLALLLTAIAPLARAGQGAGPVPTTIAAILDDMTLAPDAAPDGVPQSYDWADGAAHTHHLEDVPFSVLSRFHAMTAWGQVYPARGGNPATNLRVQVRNMRAFILRRHDMRWVQVQSAPRPIGALYAENMNGWNRPADMRPEPDGGMSARIEPGLVFHFFPAQRAPFDPSDVVGVWTSYEARLIPDNPGGPDTRARARLIANSGADVWPGLSGDSTVIAPEIGTGRFRWLTGFWQVFSMTSLTEKQLRDHPPPH